MATTQDHIAIKEIKDDVVFLKDGSIALVLKTTAVNFGLLSENEQLAIISAFAALLNSLSFAIQIIIRSKRLDISSYLNLLATSQRNQKNPLLTRLMSSYRSFIERMVRENQVLDKQFYLIIPLSYLEVGLTTNSKAHFEKAMTLLLPRRDHIIRQIWRTGLKATQLNTKQLIELYYDIYNPSFKPDLSEDKAVEVRAEQVQQAKPVVAQLPKEEPKIQPAQPRQPIANMNSIQSQQPIGQMIPQQPRANQPASAVSNQQPISQPQTPAQTVLPKSTAPATPFVVEELSDDYGTSQFKG